MRALIRIALASLALGFPLVAHAQGGRGAALKQVHTLAAPAWIRADHTPTGVQLHWATVPDVFEYFLYRVANGSAPDTGLIGRVPASNIAVGKDGAFFDLGHNEPAEYRVMSADVNMKRGPAAKVTYTPPPTKIPLKDPRKP